MENNIDVTELKRRYEEGERNFQKTCLRLANLSNTCLENINLCGSDLMGTNLCGANLCGANLSDVNLENVNLNLTNLSGADLSRAIFKETCFMGADLEGTYIGGTDLAETKYLESSKNYQKVIFKEKIESNIKEINFQDNCSNLTNNQGVSGRYQWNNLYFSSKSEIKIAKALERVGVLFYPNCRARINTPKGRETKETDFLIFYEGKWGILEVDGKPFHPPTRAVQDHERDRLFKVHGISIVEHYDAQRCWKDPDGVVDEFIKILSQGVVRS